MDYVELNINNHKVLLDKKILEFLKGFNSIGKGSSRKYIIPLGITRTGYVEWGGMLNVKRQCIRLHHLVVGKPLEGFVVDHLNRNPLDNRKENLKVVKYRDNYHNTVRNSGYVGVCWHKGGNKWLAAISVDGKHRYLGLFSYQLTASAAYQMAKELMETI